MADDKKLRDRKDEPAAPGDGRADGTKAAWYRRFLSRRWLVVVIVASLVLHGAGFAWYRMFRGPNGPGPTPEVPLGTYEFVANPQQPGHVARARFSLHIALLSHVDPGARQRLHTREHRVRQNVEELLREAHGGDFEDPGLAGLKRQLQERINETLEMRAIADVVITNLELIYREPFSAPPHPATAEARPWAEPPSG